MTFAYDTTQRRALAPQPAWIDPPVAFSVADDLADTPLFAATARRSAIPAADAERTIRVMRSLPERWQEVLWYTRVEGVSIMEASIHIGLTQEVTSAVATRAMEGLCRAWLDDYMGPEPLPPSCASTLWRICASEAGAPDNDTGVHLAHCERCAEADRRLGAILDGLPEILLPVALEQLG